MSAWPGKYVIGLTGNIASGKSVVRRMLEHAGAFGIDADALSHRAIQRGAPGYQAVLDAFGTYVLKGDGEVDRKKLGSVVFADPEALKLLESIVHPLVRQAVDYLAGNSIQQVIVLEAIKLLESPLAEACDSIWVVTAGEAAQLERLHTQRGMDEAEARRRMAAQSPEWQKAAKADVVIDNSGTLLETWEQVKDAWKKLFPRLTGETVPSRLPGMGKVGAGGLHVLRARPREIREITDFILRQNGAGETDANRLLSAFGEKAILLLRDQQGLQGLLGWKVENLVARVDDIHMAKDEKELEMLAFLVEEMETASSELQCEVALVFVEPQLAAQRELWQQLGYEERFPHELTVTAWQEAALESLPPGTVMLFKQLRADRVLRPI
ncbi:MAG: dephospho-CoA kinase [Anaerolineales bacterium]|nr:dephospho-CoA kinase [Anaerolineales bacterium]